MYCLVTQHIDKLDTLLLPSFKYFDDYISIKLVSIESLHVLFYAFKHTILRRDL